MSGGILRVRATVRLRNDAMLEAREKLGLTQKECAEAVGIPLVALQEMERLNFRKMPFDRVVKVAEFLELAIEDILPEGADFQVPPTIVAQQAVHVSQLLALQRQHDSRLMLPAPDKILEDKELRETIEKALGRLSYREREVVKQRLSGATLEEVGARFNVCRDRINQIEAKAIRKLQHPTVKKIIEEAL